MDCTFAFCLEIGKITSSPGFKTPLSILPTGTVPTPLIAYTSCIGILSGLPVGFSGALNSPRAAIKDGPLYQVILSLASVRPSPVIPLVGTNLMALTRSGVTSFDLTKPAIRS